MILLLVNAKIFIIFIEIWQHMLRKIFLDKHILLMMYFVYILKMRGKKDINYNILNICMAIYENNKLALKYETFMYFYSNLKTSIY